MAPERHRGAQVLSCPIPGVSLPPWGEAPSFCLLWVARGVHKLAGPEGRGSGDCLERVGRTYSDGCSRESPILREAGRCPEKKEAEPSESDSDQTLCNPHPLGH